MQFRAQLRSIAAAVVTALAMAGMGLSPAQAAAAVNALPTNPSLLVNVAGSLFFTASDGVHGREVWKSDGTRAGTVLVKDINAQPG